jgi:hypothetical protein
MRPPCPKSERFKTSESRVNEYKTPLIPALSPKGGEQKSIDIELVPKDANGGSEFYLYENWHGTCGERDC